MPAHAGYLAKLSEERRGNFGVVATMLTYEIPSRQMSQKRRPPFELGSCFREAFLARFDPEVQEAVRLFGRLLDDLVLERSLSERGAREDFRLELDALVVELETLARVLETIGAEVVANSFDEAEARLGEVVVNLAGRQLGLSAELAAALGQGSGRVRARVPPARRRKDGPRGHLRPVPPPEEP
jgi:hypothetical protein